MMTHDQMGSVIDRALEELARDKRTVATLRNLIADLSADLSDEGCDRTSDGLNQLRRRVANALPIGHCPDWLLSFRTGPVAIPKETYRVSYTRGEWIVEGNLPCINGLSAWVEVANCGTPDETDQMHDLDREQMAMRIARELNRASN